MKYFAETVPGSNRVRYHILRGSTVISTQFSRPDGEEVRRPADVRFAHAKKESSPIKKTVYAAFAIAPARQSSRTTDGPINRR